MLQILIVGTDTSGSLVMHDNKYAGTIKRFPKKLSNRVVGVLDRLRKSKVYGIMKYSKHGGLVLSKDGQGYTCDLGLADEGILDKDSVLQANEAIELLYWYLEPHIHYPPPGSHYGAEPICCDCGYSQLMYDADRCSSPECTSHKKWTEVIDEYSPSMHTLNRTFLGIPKVGELR